MGVKKYQGLLSGADLVSLPARRKIRWGPDKKNPHSVDLNAPVPGQWVRSAGHLACKLGVLIFFDGNRRK